MYPDFQLTDKKIWIECDGQEHFKPVRFNNISIEKAEENLKIVQLYDQIKNKYCEEHGIKLIRIKYNENIKEKVLKELK
jgi:very-short-patch-repair endonuclease